MIENIEMDMQYIGMTGVEDRLQEHTRETITNLRSAGVKVWMLSGDKMETAECIAISSGIK